MGYIEKLEKIGFLKCCAIKIVNDYLNAGKEKELVEYIDYKTKKIDKI